MKGKDFEKLCLYQLDREEKAGHLSAGRYGVQATYRDEQWQPIDSLPDIEGDLAPDARHFIFDCKVCRAASFPLDDDKFEKRQKRHLYRRARVGAITFLLIHFPERQLKKRTDEELTVAFPVHPGHPFWETVDRGEVKRIQRQDCEEYGVRVAWSEGRGNPRPDLLPAIRAVSERLTECQDMVASW